MGIVSALKSEANCLTKQPAPLLKIVRLAPGTHFCLGGMGSGAMKASGMLHENGARALISFGVAGALDKNLMPGDLVLPEKIYFKRTNLPVNLEWRKRVSELLSSDITVIGNTLAHTQSPLFTQQEKLKFGEETGACAVDMESAIVAEYAMHHNIPFVAIRAIVDPVKFSPPQKLLGAVNQDGTTRIVKLLPLVFNGSVSISTLYHLAMGMQAACSTLKKVVESVGLDFTCELHMNQDSKRPI